MQATNVIQFPVIPIKPADRPQAYRCIQCGERMTWPWRVDHAVYCEHDGAEMRPVEAK